MKTTMFKPVIHTAVAAAVAALLAACGTVGPNFVAPRGIDTPAWRGAPAAGQTSTQASTQAASSETARLPALVTQDKREAQHGCQRNDPADQPSPLIETKMRKQMH